MARDKHSDADIARYQEKILGAVQDSPVAETLQPDILRIIASVRAGEETWHARYGTQADRRTFLHGVGVELAIAGGVASSEGDLVRAEAAYKAAFESAHLAFRQSEAKDPMRAFHGSSMTEYAARIPRAGGELVTLSDPWFVAAKQPLLQANRAIHRHRFTEDIYPWGFAQGYEATFQHKMKISVRVSSQLLSKIA